MALKPASVQWSDEGSLRSLDYDDIYFQRGQGLEESRYVFIEKNNLPDRFKNLATDTFYVAELGFGSGINFLLTVKEFLDTAPASARLFYASIEKHPLEKKDFEKIHTNFPALATLSAEVLKQYPPLIEGFHHLPFAGGRIRLMLMLGDVVDTLPQLSGTFDTWYLDGFSHAKNAAMWEDGLYPLIAKRTKEGGTLATFSAVPHMMQGLEEAGFTVEKVKGYGIKRKMTVAKKISAAPNVPAHKKNIVVIGAGIAGCSAAYALAIRGYRVTVIDRNNGAAAETSGNPAGIVYPKLTVDSSPLGLYHSHAFCFTANLLQNLALPSWKPCGVLHLDMDEEDKKRTDALFEKRQYPQDFARRTAAGIFQPTAGFLSPPEFCRKLLDHPNIKTRFGVEADRIENDSIVIIAQGHDSKKHAQTSWLPLQSLRGQITFLKETQKSKTLEHIICHDGYITPAMDGLHYIGASFQKEEPEAPVLRDEDQQENLEKLQKTLPQFGFDESCLAGGRTGYRTTTPDKLPLAGRCPDYDSFLKKKNGYIDNLYISTGFGAHGMTGAPLAGEIVACLIAGDPLPVPQKLYEHLMPERFILRDIKRKKI